MEGLRGELRRLGFATSRVNGGMAKAARKEYSEPVKAGQGVVVRRTVVCLRPVNEAVVREQLAVIATAFRNGLISEEKARALVMAIDGRV